jgi:hypothetical protein
MSGPFLDDSFNPQNPPFDEATPTLDQLINLGISNALLEVHTMIPCTIVAIRNNGCFVDLQPSIKRVYQDGTIETLPVIQQVPVQMMRGNDFYIKPPVAVNDQGFAVFCERSLDNWVVSGGLVESNDTRTHDLSDCVYVPGMYPLSSVLAGNPNDMILSNGKALMSIQKAGTYKIANAQQELITNLVNLTQTLIDAMVATAIGPQPFIPTTVMALTTIKTNLNTLKGT